MKKTLAFLLVGLVFLLAACGTSNSAEPQKSSAEGKQDDQSATTGKEKSFKIGVTQFVEHPSLDEAYKGFQAALADAGIEAEYIFNSGNGDPNANMPIAQKLVGEQVDLIFANSTPSAQAAKSATADIPIVFTSVTDAVGAELIASMEKPGANVTGTIDLHPDTIASTVAFLKDELGAKKVGTIYNSGEPNSNSQVKQVKQALTDAGLKLEEASVAASSEVRQATESLIGKVDALYIITDNTVVSSLESVIDVANANQLPLMVGELDSVARGGLGAYGFAYYDIGYEAGQMAVQILLEGKSPGDIPAAYPANFKLAINKGAADALGLEIKDSWNAEIK